MWKSMFGTYRSTIPVAMCRLAPVVLVLSLCFSPQARAEEANRIVLRVNERIATLLDYERLKQERAVAIARSRLGEAERQEMLSQIGEAVLRDLFDEMLVLSRADQLGERVDEAEIEQALAQTKENYGIQSEQEFELALSQSGMTRDDLRTQIEKNLLIRKVMSREVYSQLDLEEEELRRYYRENLEEFTEPAKLQLREFVVLDSAGLAADEMQSLGASLREAVIAGGGEAAIAQSESAGQTTGWIELDWVTREDLDPQLAAAVEELPVEGVSEPTGARGGLHVLQLLGTREPEVLSFQDVADRIRAVLSDRLFQDALDGYMRDLEAKAHIVSNPPPDAAGFRATLRGAERMLDDPLQEQLDAATQSADDDGGDAESP